MLIASVVLYLLVTIAIGLWAAMRVKNSKDYVVAGRSLPLYMNTATVFATRSEEHTSELQSPCNLVCRLLLEKKKLIPLTLSSILLVCVPLHPPAISQCRFYRRL